MELTDKMNPDIITYKGSCAIWGKFIISEPAWLYMYTYYFYSVSQKSGEFNLLFKWDSSGSWAFIESVRFLIDGEISDFEANKRPRRDVGRGKVKEYLWITVPDQFFVDMQNANSVSIRVYGSKRTIDKDFTPDIVEGIIEFYTSVKQKVEERTSSSL